MVTVTFSHQGVLDLRAGVWVADAAANTRAAILSTTTLLRPPLRRPNRRRHLPHQRATAHLVSTPRDHPFDRAPARGFVPRDRLEPGDDERQLARRQVLDADELVARMADGADQLVELGLDRRSVAVLRVLDEEDHQERDDGRAGVDDQLPGVRIVEQRPGHEPDDDDQEGEDERQGLARPLRHPVRCTLEEITHCRPPARHCERSEAIQAGSPRRYAPRDDDVAGMGSSLPQIEMGAGIAASPHLRRAKDMPVFVTWLIEPEGQPTRSRSWLTS